MKIDLQQLISFFTLWLFGSPSTIIMWIFSISASFGHILFSNWYKSTESSMFYFLLFMGIITIPATIALLREFKNKLPRNKSAIPNFQKEFLIKGMFVSGLIIGLIAIEMIAFSIEFNLYMNELNEGVRNLESFKDWKESANIYLIIVPFYLFFMTYWIKKIRFHNPI